MSSTEGKFLIAGAGIAGLGVAHQLAHRGLDVVLIDRVRDFSSQGHFMTLKGTCVELLQAMGLYDALRTYEWPSDEWDWYTHTGRHLRSVAKAKIASTLGGFLSVRRTHLHKVLLDALPATVDLRLGVEIEAVQDKTDYVEVQLQGSGRETFSAVIGADGVASRLRRDYFPTLRTRDLGGNYIVFVVNSTHSLGKCTRTTWGPGRSVSLIPLAADRLGAMIYQDDHSPVCPTTSIPADWHKYLSAVYQDFPTWVREAVAAITDDDEIFTDRITMVPATKLASNRIALLGDAGYCPTFFSGMGAAAALLGGYSIAERLVHSPVPTALREYESIMIPIAQRYQRTAEGGPARNMPRGARRLLRDFVTASMPQRLGEIASRRQYQADVTLDTLAGVITSPQTNPG